MTMKDMTGQPRSDKELGEALAFIKQKIINTISVDTLQYIPIKDFLEELQQIRAALTEIARKKRELTHDPASPNQLHYGPNDPGPDQTPPNP